MAFWMSFTGWTSVMESPSPGPTRRILRQGHARRIQEPAARPGRERPVQPRRLESLPSPLPTPDRWSLSVVQRPVEDAFHDTTALLTGPLDDSARKNEGVEWQGGRVSLPRGPRRDDPPRG